jgi:hypothetical protein
MNHCIAPPLHCPIAALHNQAVLIGVCYGGIAFITALDCLLTNHCIAPRCIALPLHCIAKTIALPDRGIALSLHCIAQNPAYPDLCISRPLDCPVGQLLYWRTTALHFPISAYPYLCITQPLDCQIQGGGGHWKKNQNPMMTGNPKITTNGLLVARESEIYHKWDIC